MFTAIHFPAEATIKSLHFGWSLMGGSTELLNVQAQCCCKVSFVLVILIFINLQVKSPWCDR